MNTAVTPELLFRLKSTPFEYGRLRCGSRSSKYSQKLTPMSQISAHGIAKYLMFLDHLMRDIKSCHKLQTLTVKSRTIQLAGSQQYDEFTRGGIIHG